MAFLQDPIEIPIPVAPARPSNQIQGTFNGVPVLINPDGSFSVPGANPPTATSSPTAPWNTPALNKLGTGAMSIGKALANGASRLVFGFNIEDGAFVILGLIFITTGLLAFDKTRSVVVGAAKKAGELAAE